MTAPRSPRSSLHKPGRPSTKDTVVSIADGLARLLQIPPMRLHRFKEDLIQLDRNIWDLIEDMESRDV